MCSQRLALPPPPLQKEVAVQLRDFHLVDSLPSAGAFWICLGLCAEDTLFSGSSYMAGLLGPSLFCPVPHSCKNDLSLGNSLLDSPRLCRICLGVCHSLGSRPASSPFSCHRCEICTNLRASSLPDPVSSHLLSFIGIIAPLHKPPALPSPSQHLLPREFNSHGGSEPSHDYLFRASTWAP